MTNQIINQDKRILDIMIRKKVMHELMSQLYAYKEDNENAMNHEIEAHDIGEKIESFAKSPFKIYTPDEIKSILEEMNRPIMLGIYSDIYCMLKNKDYKPCEDCIHLHELINERRFDITSNKSYCSFHPEWPSDAGSIKEGKQVSECRDHNWKDYYQRTEKDLEALLKYLDYNLFDNFALVK